MAQVRKACLSSCEETGWKLRCQSLRVENSREQEKKETKIMDAFLFSSLFLVLSCLLC